MSRPENNRPNRDSRFIEEKLHRIGKYAERVRDGKVKPLQGKSNVDSFIEYWNKKREQIAEDARSIFVPLDLSDEEREELEIDLSAAILVAQRGELKFKKETRISVPGERGAHPNRE